jgi:hypothetical protein
MQTAVPKMKGLDCNLVGSIAGVSFCQGAAAAGESSGNHSTLHYMLTIRSDATIYSYNIIIVTSDS